MNPSPLAAGPHLSLAVVVPATDRPATLDRCLTALAAGERRPDELVVVTEPPAAGPAEARNLGAARCAAEVIVFVDSDVVVEPGALAAIERRLAGDPGLAAVFGAYDERPEAPGLASRYRNLLHHQVHLEGAGEAETFWAGLGAVRRASFEALGGFDSDRFPHASVEDVELGLRMRGQGMRIALDARIRGTHLKAWTVAGTVRTDFSRRALPWARLLLEGAGGGTALNLGWRHRFGALCSLALLAALPARRPRLALVALLGALAVDWRLYALLARRGGPRLLAAGVLLQQLHRLVALAALALAVAQHLRAGRRA